MLFVGRHLEVHPKLAAGAAGPAFAHRGKGRGHWLWHHLHLRLVAHGFCQAGLPALGTSTIQASASAPWVAASKCTAPPWSPNTSICVTAVAWAGSGQLRNDSSNWREVAFSA